MKSRDVINQYPWPVSLLVYCGELYPRVAKNYDPQDDDLAQYVAENLEQMRGIGPKTAQVLRMRFEKQMGLREIGEVFGISYEGARHIITKGCFTLAQALTLLAAKDDDAELREQKIASVWGVPLRTLKLRPEIETDLTEKYKVRTVHDLISLPARSVLRMWSTCFYFNAVKLALRKQNLVFLHEDEVEDLNPLYSAEILTARAVSSLAKQDILTVDDLLARVSYDDLLSLDGIGPVKASEIVARLHARGKHLTGTPEAVIRMGSIRSGAPGDRPVYAVMKNMSASEMADTLAAEGFMSGDREKVMGWLCSPYKKKEGEKKNA